MISALVAITCMCMGTKVSALPKQGQPLDRINGAWAPWYDLKPTFRPSDGQLPQYAQAPKHAGTAI